jgi:hypothetical protein
MKYEPVWKVSVMKRRMAALDKKVENNSTRREDLDEQSLAQPHS